MNIFSPMLDITNIFFQNLKVCITANLRIITQILATTNLRSLSGELAFAKQMTEGFPCLLKKRNTIQKIYLINYAKNIFIFLNFPY